MHAPPILRSRRLPLVSVVTIFLDAERFLDEAVESVLAQAHPRWELLLVDDGSTDGSTELAQRWARSHPERIRYLEHPGHENRGMSASRNLGIRTARGEYIAFLDADDVYLPAKLAHQVDLLERHAEVDMVYGATQYWYGWTGDARDARRDRVRRQGVPPGVVRPPELLASLLRNEARTPCTCGVLLRRSAFERTGGFEERFRGMYEDQAFFYKTFARIPVLVDATMLDRYRQHPASHVHAAIAGGRWSRRLPSPAHGEFLRWLEEFLVAERIDDPAARRALRRALRPYRSRAHRLLHVLAALVPARRAARALARRLRSSPAR